MIIHRSIIYRSTQLTWFGKFWYQGDTFVHKTVRYRPMLAMRDSGVPYLGPWGETVSPGCLWWSRLSSVCVRPIHEIGDRLCFSHRERESTPVTKAESTVCDTAQKQESGFPEKLVTKSCVSWNSLRSELVRKQKVYTAGRKDRKSIGSTMELGHTVSAWF